jgi:hypothetical protein
VDGRRRVCPRIQAALAPRQRQHAAIHQRVVNDDVGLRQAGERVERQQARISRPRSGSQT